MTEEKYNTKDIRHINEKNQEYIAEGNRMTKEIIIDGVNVAGCGYLECDTKCMIYGYGLSGEDTFCRECNGNPNCYYKQLKRLEQENKELKEWKTKVVKLFESACRCKYLNEETDICSYTNEKCININKCTYKYQELSDKYRSALEEISGLASPHCTQCSQIINIIKEVLQ